jgi:Niemann-Pick C1 protein
MFLYVGIAIGKFPSWKESGFSLALQGILIVISSVLCALGVSSFFNIGYTMISVEVIPFLILAIGVDNMFIIKNSVANQDKSLSIEDRLALGLK